ncbi:MAG: hypothetical protein LM580_11810, partial [Thermofilum sp.]|nr:hypothetical protein [Thermofilum sp.]
MSERRKLVDELLEKLVEAINGIEDERDRSAALLIALGRLLGDVDLPLVVRAGVLRLLDIAFDEMARYQLSSAASSTM